MLFVEENKWIPFFMFVGAKEKIAFGSYFGAIYLVGFPEGASLCFVSSFRLDGAVSQG